MRSKLLRQEQLQAVYFGVCEMSYGMIMTLYQMYVEHVSGSGDFLLLNGQDFLLLDGSIFLLLG